MTYSYERVAPIYDWIARTYSLGAIPAARARHLDALSPGDRVLYAGVGTGEEAVRAARGGARVTAVDLSAAMLARFSARLVASESDAELRCEDVRRHIAEPYDFVVANFFLNVFDRAEMTRVLAHLCALVAPGGELWIADFAAGRASGLGRSLRALHYRPVNVAAWMLGLCALHPIYDYAEALRAIGPANGSVEVAPFGPFGLYETVRARGPAG